MTDLEQYCNRELQNNETRNVFVSITHFSNEEKTTVRLTHIPTGNWEEIHFTEQFSTVEQAQNVLFEMVHEAALRLQDSINKK